MIYIDFPENENDPHLVEAMSTRPVSNMWLLQKQCTCAHPVPEIRSNKKTLHVWTTGNRIP